MKPTIPESHADLLDAPLATLATIGPDGRPQLSTVWFLAEDGTIRVSLNTARQKTRNLMARPAVTLHVQDAANPARYLEVRDDAAIDDDDDYEFADRVGAKYGGVDLRNMDRPGERRVMITIEPTRINAIDLSAS